MIASHEVEIAARLITAAVLGGAVGLERERLEWVAGLRTHMLVALGSALVMLVSAYGFSDILSSEHVVLDPSRVAAQVVSGIGFLGAGTILFLRQEIIRGLTTAASLWSVAAVGLAVGGGLYGAALISTVLILVILALVKPLERRIFRRNQHRQFHLEVDRQLRPLARIEAEIQSLGLTVEQLTVIPRADSDSIELRFTRGPKESALTELVNRLQSIEGVLQISLRAEAAAVR